MPREMHIMNVNLYRFLVMEEAERYEINNPHDKLLKVLNKIANKCDSEEKEIKMKRIIKYILEPVLGEKETGDMLEKFNKTGGDGVMTAIDYLLKDIEEEKRQARISRLSEGRQEGKTQGIEEGRKEGGRDTAIRIAKELLNTGMDPTIISKITKLKQEEIIAIC